jgi:hypothetical protein
MGSFVWSIPVVIGVLNVLFGLFGLFYNASTFLSFRAAMRSLYDSGGRRPSPWARAAATASSQPASA